MSKDSAIAALLSFFIPGLGQLIQGRVLSALLFFLVACVLWFVWLGWLVHIASIIDAALWDEGPVDPYD